MSDCHENDNVSGENHVSNEVQDDTFKLLIASDINLGYEETLQRKQFDDSFITFEEVLKHAVKQQVDAILFAGNLFYSSKPSQIAMIKCINLLRKYCLGTRDLKIQLLNDLNITQNDKEKYLNFEDPNFNVQIPVFCIHGSNDESVHGEDGPLDILSTCGLLNYFGNVTNPDYIEVNPLILKKGNTVLALYGMGYIHGQKVLRIFEEEKIEFRKINSVEGLKETFNLLMIHQTRGNNSYSIKDNVFPNCFNLIIWGHEHKCSIEPKKVSGKNYYISQPGSTVATSLTAVEAMEKCIGILNINKTEMKMQKIKLNTIRPFLYKTIKLREQPIQKRFPRSKQVFNFLSEYIEEELIPSAKEQLTGHKFQPKLPLIKLQVIYDNENDVCDTISLCRQFCDDVVNAMEMLMWKKSRFGKSTHCDEEEDDAWTGTDDEKTWYLSIQDRLNNYFSQSENREKLHVISIKGLNHALTQFVEKEDENVFNAVVNFEIDKCIKYVASCNVTKKEEIFEKIEEFCSSRLEEEDEHAQEIIEMLHSTSKLQYTRGIMQDTSCSFDSIANEGESDLPSTSKERDIIKNTISKKVSNTAIQNESSNKNNLNISITSAKKRGRGKSSKITSTSSKIFVKPPTQSHFRIPDIFDSQNPTDPLDMEDHHCGQW